MVLDHLRTAGVHQTHKTDSIHFTSLQPWPGEYIGAEGRFLEGETERRAAILIGPEFGTLSRMDLVTAAREASEARFDVGAAVAAWIDRTRAEGIHPSEIALFVRTRDELARARAAVEATGLSWLELSERDQDATGQVLVGTMHLAKGLEFKSVGVIACDDGILPLQSRLEGVADETELDDVYETERHLFYVACTRARDRLLITAVRPASEYIQDLGAALPT
jgi:superfamily I DNA/RNA helicase